MIDASLFERHTTTAARRLAPQLWLFAWVGLGLLVPGVVISNASLSLAFTISSTTVFAMAMIVVAINRKYEASPRHFHDSLDVFVHNDSAPTFCISDDCEINYANRAARTRFGEVEGKSLVMVLGQVVSNPINVIFELKQQARVKQSATRDIVTNSGHLRLSAHALGRAGFVWRLEDMVERTVQADESVQAIGLPMLLVNDEGRILHMNSALIAKTGCRVSHVERLFHDLPIRTNGLHRVTTRNGLETVRVVAHPRPDNRTEYYLVTGDPQEISGAAMGRLIDELPVALVKLTPAGTVLEANRPARKLLEIKEIRPQTNMGLLLEGLGRPVGDWLRAASDGQLLHRPEILRLTRNAKDRFLQVTLARVVEQGETFLIAVLNDATELKSLEAQFVQSQKMQAIGQLAGGVAHDFNNLLTAISGYCDLLLLRHDEGDPSFGDLVQISQNSNRAASLVSQLLAFSRKQNLQPETLDLRETISDLSHLLNRLLGEMVTLSVVNHENLSRVRADKRQLEQVLMNLVVNARDAMDASGEVTIETENLHLEQDLSRDRAVVEKGDYVSIKVSDNGPGIPAASLAKIYEPFFTTKKAGEGTGLGLSMVYGIVKQTGGFIFVDSAPGQGCQFQILLPANNEQSRIVRKVPQDLNTDRLAPVSGMVLLVEDEAPVRTFAARALRLRGFDVTEAQNGEEALELLKDKQFDVDMFVTDVIMPGLDGPAWVREAQKERPDTRVIFVSGYAEESFGDRQALIAHSVFLPKPFSLNDLTDTVQRHMGSSGFEKTGTAARKVPANLKLGTGKS